MPQCTKDAAWIAAGTAKPLNTYPASYCQDFGQCPSGTTFVGDECIQNNQYLQGCLGGSGPMACPVNPELPWVGDPRRRMSTCPPAAGQCAASGRDSKCDGSYTYAKGMSLPSCTMYKRPAMNFAPYKYKSGSGSGCAGNPWMWLVVIVLLLLAIYCVSKPKK
jgi:hypothetical protein